MRYLRRALILVSIAAAPIILPIAFTDAVNFLSDREDQKMNSVTAEALKAGLSTISGSSLIRCIFPPGARALYPLKERFDGYTASRNTDSRDSRIWIVADVHPQSRKIELSKFVANEPLAYRFVKIPCGSGLKLLLPIGAERKFVEFSDVDFELP